TERHPSMVRYLLAVVGVLAIIAGLAGIKFKQISTLISFGEAMAKSGPPPEIVGTAVSTQQDWQGTLSAVGSLSPARGVTVGNEVAGTVTAIRFESGQMVKQGQVLVELDTSVERAQLNSAIARRELAVTNAPRSRALIEKSAIARAQFDRDESALRGSQADVGALQAQIERKTVRAAFAGRLGIRHVNLGQYLSPGTPITELQAIDQTYVDFTLPQADLPDVAVGQAVRTTIEGGGDPVDGKIAAIDPTLANATRTIKV